MKSGFKIVALTKDEYNELNQFKGLMNKLHNHGMGDTYNYDNFTFTFNGKDDNLVTWEVKNIISWESNTTNDTKYLSPIKVINKDGSVEYGFKYSYLEDGFSSKAYLKTVYTKIGGFNPTYDMSIANIDMPDLPAILATNLKYLVGENGIPALKMNGKVFPKEGYYVMASKMVETENITYSKPDSNMKHPIAWKGHIYNDDWILDYNHPLSEEMFKKRYDMDITEYSYLKSIYLKKNLRIRRYGFFLLNDLLSITKRKEEIWNNLDETIHGRFI